MHYLTVRSLLAALSALLVSLLLGPFTIRQLQALQIGQSVRDDGPKSHLVKSGTPTMGGVLILLGVTISVLLWGDLSNRYLWVVLLTTLAFGLIGWVDDYRKVVLKNAKGLSAKQKYLMQSVVGFLVALYMYFCSNVHGDLLVPFFKHLVLNLSWFYPIFCYLVIVGSSNAVNLTDGLDGLATPPVVMIAVALGVFAYAMGNVGHAQYLGLPYIHHVGELMVFTSALAGAGLGFLWYNTHPAEVFMGDVGSLSLGASLGAIAVCVKQELVLFIMSGIFVLETLSVILQVIYFKLTGGKRIFRMAPLHHHFELKGWAEEKVTVRFWILTVIFVLIGLMSLKFR